MGVAATATLSLAGCGNNGQPSTMHNEADVEFAQQMVPHRRQAAKMAELAASRASNDKVKDVANAPGRMTDGQMRQLEQVSGADFEIMFLDMMVQHHGAKPDAKALAQRIIETQEAEIIEMMELIETR